MSAGVIASVRWNENPGDSTHVLALARRLAESGRNQAAEDGGDDEPGDPEKGEERPILGAVGCVVAKVEGPPTTAAVREEPINAVGRRSGSSCTGSDKS